MRERSVAASLALAAALVGAPFVAALACTAKEPAAVAQPARVESRTVERDAPGMPFDSREACERSLAGPESADAAPSALRVASWNVRWFPDGEADTPGPRATDVEWLACAIVASRVDVLAVQEFVRHERGRAALDALLASLGRRTGAAWRAVFDACPADGRQHVGFLHRTDRVTLGPPRSLAAEGGDPHACARRLRPALHARAELPGGRAVDLLVVHLDSGTTARDRGHREGATRAIAALVGARPRDEAIVVLGDFNTMGCVDCRPRLDAATETNGLVAAFRAVGLERAEPTAACTERTGRGAATLDHVFVRASGDGSPGAEVLGPCARACGAARGAFFERLSDHCPIAIDLALAPAPTPSRRSGNIDVR